MMSCSSESGGQMNVSDRGSGMDFNETAIMGSYDTYPKHINNTTDFSYYSSFGDSNMLHGKNKVPSDCVYHNTGSKWTAFILINFIVMFALPIVVSVV